MISVKSAIGALVLLAVVAAPTGCAATGGPVAVGGRLEIVAAEVQYGDVAAQVGGDAVTVLSVQSNPNTDPHNYEVSPRLAQEIGRASVVVQNGLGYDSFMNTVEAAIGSPRRKVIDVGKLVGRAAQAGNPHLWYDPRTMPAVASALASELAALQPSRADYFHSNAVRFTSSLQPWRDALSQLRTEHPGVPVATTEPVADYMIQAAGAVNLTPFSFQADVMNGLDPPPQGVTIQTDLLRHHRVKALLYNQQVTDSVTAGFVREAVHDGVPVVAVYETMPVPGYDYQSWMLAEVRALQRAVSSGVSTRRL